MNKQIFVRSTKHKSAPPPDSFHPSPSSPRKAAGAPASTIIFD
jgi:hypothetical protein